MIASFSTTLRPRVGLLTYWHAPYRDPVIAELQRRGNVDVEILLLYNKDPAHSYQKYKETFNKYVPPGRVYKAPIIGDIHASLIQHIARTPYDVLVVGGHDLAISLYAIALSLAKRKAFIYSADSVLTNRNPSLKSATRNFIIRHILKNTAAVWVPGVASRRYMVQFGVPAERIFEGYYCLDCYSILAKVGREKSSRIQLRTKLNVPSDAFVFLMVGNFTQRRHHLVLLEALSLVENTHKPYLILIGSGQEESILRKFCGKCKLDNVRFLNNVQFEDLAAYYAAADAYVHTGIEPYSNSVIYGAIAGLPIISTTHIGGAQEIFWKSIGPFLVEPNDTPMISHHMAWLAAHPEAAAALGADLQKIALTRNPVWAAEQFEKAVRTALRSMIR